MFHASHRDYSVDPSVIHQPSGKIRSPLTILSFYREVWEFVRREAATSDARRDAAGPFSKIARRLTLLVRCETCEQTAPRLSELGAINSSSVVL